MLSVHSVVQKRNGTRRLKEQAPTWAGLIAVAMVWVPLGLEVLFSRAAEGAGIDVRLLFFPVRVNEPGDCPEF